MYLDDADEASSPISITIIRELLFARVKLDLMSGQDWGYDASQRMQYCCNNPVEPNLHYGIPSFQISAVLNGYRTPVKKSYFKTENHVHVL